MTPTLRRLPQGALACVLLLFTLFAAAPPAAGHEPLPAEPVPADPCDPLTHVFGTVGDFTEIAFGAGGVPPIPAGFFFPGSQPFAGSVSLAGGALAAGVPGDTAIELAASPQDPGLGYPFKAPAVAAALGGLSLSSTGTLSVGGGPGGADQWLLGIGPSAAQSPSGALSARFDSPAGGAFDAALPVLPALVFVRLADVQAHLAGALPANKIAVRYADFGALGLEAIELALLETPFSTVPLPDSPCDGNFFPAVLPGGEGGVIVSTAEPFEPVRHVFEPPPPVKHCVYRHASSTPSQAPRCQPNCPAGLAPMTTNDKCQTTADCPPFKIRSGACATQGQCAEVYVVHACV